MTQCGACKGDGWIMVRRPVSGTRRSPQKLRCRFCGGAGHLGETVAIPLRAKQRTEAFEQYHEDTHILQELGLTISNKTIDGAPERLRELAVLIAQDYDRETGFETVSASVKREMLSASERILRVVGVPNTATTAASAHASLLQALTKRPSADNLHKAAVIDIGVSS